MPKGSTLKKPKTLNKNKKSNKFDLNKNWMKTAFIGMAAILFFTSVGYGAVRYYQVKKASANNWQYVLAYGRDTVYGCIGTVTQYSTEIKFRFTHLNPTPNNFKVGSQISTTMYNYRTNAFRNYYAPNGVNSIAEVVIRTENGTPLAYAYVSSAGYIPSKKLNRC